MSPEPVTCPYCNAQVTPPPGLPAGRRVPCPRCGEEFTLRQPTLADNAVQPPPGLATAPGPQVTELPARPSPALPEARRSNRTVAGMVLGLMVLMAAGGLALALWTQSVRRAHDKGIVKRPSRRPESPPPEGREPAVDAVAPARLAALRYLPRETSLLAGLHVRELLASPAGKELVDAPLGPARVRLSSVVRWAGLPAGDVDHLVVGVEAEPPARVPPPVCLVVRTRAEYDPAAVKEALHAKREETHPTPEGGTRTLYPCTVPVRHQDLPAVLWLADERTVVLGLFDTRLPDVPGRPHEGGEELAKPLRTVLDKRMSAGSPLWVAGYSKDWNQTRAGVLLALLGRPDALKELAAVRAFGVSVRPEKTLTIQAEVQCVSEKAARRLAKDSLGRWGKSAGEMKVATDGEWVTAQLKTDLAALRKALGK